MGIFVTAGFGLLLASLARIDSTLVVPVLVVSLGVIVALVVGGVRVRRAAATLPPVAPDPAVPNRNVGRRFGQIVGAELVAVGAAVAVLNVTSHPHLISAVICTAVGLHFVPLAATFRAPLFYGRQPPSAWSAWPR